MSDAFPGYLICGISSRPGWSCMLPENLSSANCLGVSASLSTLNLNIPVNLSDHPGGGGGCEFRSKICLDSGLWWNFEGQVLFFFFTLSTQCQSRDKQVLLPFLCVHWVSASFLLFLMICPLQSWGWVPVFVVEPCLQYEQGFISGPWPPSIYQGRNSAYELPLRLSFLSKVHLKHLLKV